MVRDPHDDGACTSVLAGLQDIYLHVDALHNRCLSFLNGGGQEEFLALLSCADEVLQSVWWLARNSLASLIEARVIGAGAAVLYTKVAPKTLEGHDSYDGELRNDEYVVEGTSGWVSPNIGQNCP